MHQLSLHHLPTVLHQAIQITKDSLVRLAQHNEFYKIITTAFGDKIDFQKLHQIQHQWLSRNFIHLPSLEIRSTTEICGADGAYAQQNHKIYLAKEYLERHYQSHPLAIANVLLEEIGHWLDTQINVEETPGDEGAIFSALVRGESLNEQQLQQLRNENDSAITILEGKIVEIEQAIVSFTGNVLLYDEDQVPPDVSRTEIPREDRLQAFNEQQNFILTEEIFTNNPENWDERSGSIPAGTVINSHYIALAPAQDPRLQETATFTFEHPILGLIGWSDELLATNDLLGLDITYSEQDTTHLDNEPVFTQLDDTAQINGNTLEITISNDSGLDPVRVITSADIAQVTGEAIFIDPPLDVSDQQSQVLQIFPEQQNFILPEDIPINDTADWNQQSGVIPAGTQLSSYYIYLDPQFVDVDTFFNAQANVTFNQPILGIIGGSNELLETNPILGLDDVIYPAVGQFGPRGMDENNPNGTRDSADFEGNTVTLDVTARDGIDPVRVLVAAEGEIANSPPTALILSNNLVSENSLVGTEIGILSTTDIDVGDTHTYTLVAGDGDLNNNVFTIESDRLLINNSPDFETQNSYTIRVRSTDTGGLFTEDILEITVEDINEIPTQINLSETTVAENISANTAIATLSTIDPDAEETHTYTLVIGEGDTDNNSFFIEGNQLFISNSPDFETQENYSLRIRSTDSEELFLDTIFTLTVTDENETPNFTSTPLTTIDINQLYNYTVTATDPEADLLTLTTNPLPTWLNFIDNGDGTALLSGTPTINEVGSFPIELRVEDEQGLSETQSFNLEVAEVNLPPTEITLSSQTVDENVDLATVVGTFATVDLNPNQTHTYTLIGGGEGFFEIVGNQLQTTGDLDHEQRDRYEITIRSTDNGSPSLSLDTTLTITVNDLLEVTPEPEPTPEPVPEPTPEPTPEPVSEPTPEPEPQPNSSPDSDPEVSEDEEVPEKPTPQDPEMNDDDGEPSDDPDDTPDDTEVIIDPSSLSNFDLTPLELDNPSNPVDGSNESDQLLGTDNSETINSLSGDDVIFGLGSADQLFADEGNDQLFGNQGTDWMNGGSGDDTLYGGQDADTLAAETGNDHLFGNKGDDFVFGQQDNDWANGNQGQDQVVGGEGDDTLYGGQADDTLIGGTGNDQLSGDKGSDILVGVEPSAVNPGINQVDQLTGGSEGDTFVLADLDTTYYIGQGTADYALITDFDPNQDTIQLHGDSEDYQLDVQAEGVNLTLITDTQPELVAIIQTANPDELSLTATYFSFS